MQQELVAYELSHAEKRLWILEQIDPHNPIYNMQSALIVEGDLRVEQFIAALQTIAERHEILRTYFMDLEGVPYQIVKEDVQIEIPYEDLTNLSTEEQDARVRELNEYESTTGFDLTTPPLIRGRICRLAEEKYIFFLTMHHIVSDGWSLRVFEREILQIYEAYLVGKPNPLTPLRIQYKDFTEWQNDFLGSGQMEEQQKYWMTMLGGELPVLNLKTDYARPQKLIHCGETIDFFVNPTQIAGLENVAKQENSTLFMILLSAFYVLLHKYTRQEELIVGTPITGRNNPQLEGLIGFFVNTLALRNRVESDWTFRELLREVKNIAMEAYKNQDYPFDKLVEDLNPERLLNMHPIFNVMFDFQPVMDTGTIELSSLKVQRYPLELTSSKFDLQLYLRQTTEGILGHFEYSTELFKKSTIQRMKSHYLNLLEAIVVNLDQQIMDLKMITPEEEQKLLYDFNDTAYPYPDDQCYQQLFEAQVDKTPDHKAVTFKGKSLTYRELNQRANQFAHYLRDLGVKPDTLIGFMVDPSLERAIGVIGILKSGGAYLPIETNYPQSRILSILEDSKVEILVITKDSIELANDLQWELESMNTIVCLDTHDIQTYVAEKEIKQVQTGSDIWNFFANKGTNLTNASGWVNSYDNQEFSLVEIEDLFRNVIEKVSPYLHPESRVLEVGCGSGLIMYELAPLVGHFHGVDLSEKIIERNHTIIKEKGYQNIRLDVMAAHEIEKLNTHSYDVIIMNSVVQYFPGINYLKKVIDICLHLLTEKGILFIGDIRNKDLQQAFYESLFAGQNLSPAHLEAKIAQKYKTETELFIKPDFFAELPTLYKEIREVHLSSKLARVENELTRYRFDSVIQLGQQSQVERVRHESQKRQHDLNHIESYSIENPPVVNTPSDLAYCIYTSGSTGRPKGAMIEHGGMINHIYAKTRDLGITSDDIMAHNASICFDISVWQMFTMLIFGGETIYYSKEVAMSPELLFARVKEDGVSILEVVPTFLHVFVDNAHKIGDLHRLRFLVVTGEAISKKLVNRWLDLYPTIPIANVYGQTESSDDTTHYIITEKLPETMEQVPIGKAVINTKVYVLDEALQLTPIGVPGEIYEAGICVGRGYLNRPDLTEKQFITNPFTPGERMYRTGDLGRIVEDGTIEFFGRIDHQVKIRGNRVELGEIEAIFTQHKNILEAVVVVKEDELGNNYLVGYLVSKEEVPFSELRDYLLGFLPDYMIPSQFVRVEKMPVNPNGKVDRKALPDPEGTEQVCEGYVAPRNEIEERVAEIWANVLGVSKIGVKDNFFERGGHSLNALQLVSKVNEVFSAQFSPVIIFSNPTVEEFARALHVEVVSEYEFECVVPLRKTGAQRNIFMVHPGGGTVNCYQPLVNLLDERYDVYGIQALGFTNLKPLHPSFEDMAEYYIQEMKMIQPVGPYTIVSWCAGADIIVEMARILEDNNDAISQFIILDALPFEMPQRLQFDIEESNRQQILRTFIQLGMATDGCDSKPVAELLMELYHNERFRKEYGVVSFDALKRIEEVQTNILNIWRHQTPTRPIHQDLIVYKATETHYIYEKDDWAKWTTGAVEMYDTPGTHNEIAVVSPFVDRLAEQLNRILR